MSFFCGWHRQPVIARRAFSRSSRRWTWAGTFAKGERGTKVYFVKQLQIREEADEAPARLVPMMREYTVFNVDQCDGLPDSVAIGKPIRVRNPREELADAFLRSTRADIREGYGEAYYVPSRDFISMPALAGFKGADHFYNVTFHELTHWTGHKSRLDRDLKNRFGSRNYAAEELIAELGAAFLCAEFGFDGDLRHAGYIGHWIELLKADKRAFFTACSQASKAARVPARLGARGADGGCGVNTCSNDPYMSCVPHPNVSRLRAKSTTQKCRRASILLPRRLRMEAISWRPIKIVCCSKTCGAPGTIRTSDPQIRSLILYNSLTFLDFP